MLGKDSLDPLDAPGDLLVVVSGAGLPKQVFQHVARHGSVAANLLYKVLAHHVAVEGVVELARKRIHYLPL